jgi:hypothetical protein
LVEDEWEPQIDLTWEGEAARHHADHLIVASIEWQDAPDDRRITAEAALPDAVAQHHHAWTARVLFL